MFGSQLDDKQRMSSKVGGRFGAISGKIQTPREPSN